MRKSFFNNEITFRAKKSHPLEWLLEPLENHPGYLRRRMFGGEAIYINGRLNLMLTVHEEPWNGILIVTYREQHAALIAEWKPLKAHPILGKWLYLSQAHPAFETIATAVVRAIRREDTRIGIEPKLRKPRKQPAKFTQGKSPAKIKSKTTPLGRPSKKASRRFKKTL